MLATLCLNEMQWLPRLYEQHRDWPTSVKWVFVEAADKAYAGSNPELVSSQGLSVDGTTEWLQDLAKQDEEVEYIAHGFCEYQKPHLNKIAARQRYLDYAAKVRPDYVICLDADEFYTFADQARIIETLNSDSASWCWTFPKREIWRPPSILHEPLLRYEVSGGFWDIACCHWWRWVPGLAYRDCHNVPCRPPGKNLRKRMKMLHARQDIPQMLHLGFAATAEMRLAKNKYYENRGEKVDPKRSWYTESRRHFATWRPGDKLPRGARVTFYDGPVPECFASEC